MEVLEGRTVPPKWYKSLPHFLALLDALCGFFPADAGGSEGTEASKTERTIPLTISSTNGVSARELTYGVIGALRAVGLAAETGEPCAALDCKVRLAF